MSDYRRTVSFGAGWLFGPYTPDSITAGSQPDFYMGFLEGALRIMPNWETNLWGHTISWNVMVPALVPLAASRFMIS